MKIKRILHFVTVAVTIIAIALFFAVKSGTFDRDPEVEIEAENRFGQTVTVVMGNDFAPFSFEKDGEYSGHDVELANELANRIEMNVKLEFYNWNTCLEKIKSGEADIVMSADYELQINGISYSIPTANDPWIAFSSKYTKDIHNYADLYGKRIGIGEGTDPLAGSKLSANCKEYSSYDEAFDALESGELDVVITQYPVGTYICENRGHKSIRANCEISGGHLSIGVRSGREDLLARVNGAVSEMASDGTLDALNDKWCGSFVKHYSLSDLWSSNPEYFIIAIFIFLIVIGLMILLFVRAREKQRETKLREKIELQNQLIKHLIREYSEVYYIHTTPDKSKDKSELLFKGGIINKNVEYPHADLPFTAKLDCFIRDVVYADDRESVYAKTRREVIADNTQKGLIYAVDFRSLDDDGIHHNQIRFARVGESAGLEDFVVGIRRVDYEIGILEQLAAEKANAEAANRAKTEFLFNMSHDIRTPMNAILGFTDMAEKSIGDENKLTDYLEKIKKSGRLLLSLINSVLEMSRIEAGKAELNEQPGAVSFCFADIESTMKSLASAKNISLFFEFGDIQNEYVFADIDRCNRILTNIISNSVKYTGEGGKISVKCEQVGRRGEDYGLYRFTVEDNGIGISEEFQKHLYDEFSREKNSTISGVQGSGLGLSVVKSIVDLMHGTVECKSEKGVGTTFTVTLPFRIQKDIDNALCIDPVSKEIKGVGEVFENKEENSVEGKRILLVEDNEMNREIARFILEDRRIEVEEADDGTVAVELLKEKGADYYDAILMDIQMPTMNGYDATRVIREMYPEAKLPIIALSANAFAEDKAASLEVGMNDHVAKPINNAELFTVLAKFL